MNDEMNEIRVLACMRLVPEFLSSASSYLLPDYFSGKARFNLAKMMLDFWEKYSTAMTNQGFATFAAGLVKGGQFTSVDATAVFELWKLLEKQEISDWKFLLDNLVDFVKSQRIKKLIADATETLLPAGKYQAIEQEMAKIANINSSRRVQAYDYFDASEIHARHIARKNEMESGCKLSISTGIPQLDTRLHAKGFTAKELYVFMAPPKRGKTMSLLWFSNTASTAGHNVAHFTCEVSREICAKRLDAMNSKTMTKELGLYSEQVAKQIEKKGVKGKLFLFEFPTAYLTPQMLESELERLQNEQGVRIDMAVVDYLDIMKYQGAGGKDREWSKQGPLAEELRGIAGKWMIPVVTATQINRQGAGKAINSGKDVAGDYQKIMIADEVYCISATDEELKEGKARIISTESRNSESGTIVISTSFAYGQFYKDFLGEG